MFLGAGGKKERDAVALLIRKPDGKLAGRIEALGLAAKARCFGDERQIRDEFASPPEVPGRSNALQPL